MEESARANEKSHGWYHYCSKLGEPPDKPGGESAGLAFGIEDAGVPHHRRDGVGGRDHHADVFVLKAGLIQSVNDVVENDILRVHAVGCGGVGGHIDFSTRGIFFLAKLKSGRMQAEFGFRGLLVLDLATVAARDPELLRPYSFPEPMPLGWIP